MYHYIVYTYTLVYQSTHDIYYYIEVLHTTLCNTAEVKTTTRSSIKNQSVKFYYSPSLQQCDSTIVVCKFRYFSKSANFAYRRNDCPTKSSRGPEIANKPI